MGEREEERDRESGEERGGEGAGTRTTRPSVASTPPLNLLHSSRVKAIVSLPLSRQNEQLVPEPAQDSRETRWRHSMETSAGHGPRERMSTVG